MRSGDSSAKQEPCIHDQTRPFFGRGCAQIASPRWNSIQIWPQLQCPGNCRMTGKLGGAGAAHGTWGRGPGSGPAARDGCGAGLCDLCPIYVLVLLPRVIHSLPENQLHLIVAPATRSTVDRWAPCRMCTRQDFGFPHIGGTAQGNRNGTSRVWSWQAAAPGV